MLATATTSRGPVPAALDRTDEDDRAVGVLVRTGSVGQSRERPDRPDRKVEDVAVQQTLILVKPDGVRRGLIGEVISRIERKGYAIRALELMVLDRDVAERHYAEHTDKPFFGELVEFITSGALVAICVEGADAIKGMRQIMGATNPIDAEAGSLRGAFASVIGENIVHGSDSEESAKRELEIFFPGRF
jgi:nucleoside-diphosphate kinase